MKVLYFDCFSGISGDMTVGALLDLGINREKFVKELGKLKLPELKVKILKTKKNGIEGTDFSVSMPHHHHHEHGGHGHSHGRNLIDIEKIINKSAIAAGAKLLAVKIFREIGRAEAKVHGTDINEIHFHEVGALDSIADITGAAICLDMLGIEKVYSSALHDGRGTIECAHGIIPIPVPAVVEMLKGSKIPLVQENVNTEMVTPTGAGIIKTISSGFGNMPAMKIIASGYGFGKRDTGGFNALRVISGETPDRAGTGDEIVCLETNIDNMTPEMLSFAMERIFEAGAVDVFFTPVYMKKNRPAVLLTALTNAENEAAVIEAVLKHTSTLGIRRRVSERYCMERKMAAVETGYGPVKIKYAQNGNIKKLSPEYEDCRAIAIKTGLTIKEVYDMALALAPERLKKTRVKK
jgi:uncharacterized protein (TIGR00299 family) protein